MDDAEKTQVSISSVWSQLILLSTVSTAVVYVLVGLFACRRLIKTNWRWALIVVLYFAVGLLHSFFLLSLPCVAIGCIFWTIEAESIRPLEVGTFSVIMVTFICFFATGKITILYGL
uniref:Uncharacterized protein n=1 Tax=Trypanosoma congolense (strain IL3000) TaxID=1068625 RepID=G0UKM5_TRYCI|nr:conserved hypothetical protein [Trypanosoma congolense IL3000]